MHTSIRTVLTVAIVAALTLSGAGAAATFSDSLNVLGASAQTQAQNPSENCGDLAFILKLEADGNAGDEENVYPLETGTFTETVDGVTYEITITDVTYDEDGEPSRVDWESNAEIGRIVVFGGQNTTVVTDPGTSGTITAGTTPSGQQAAISHIAFCAPGEESTPTPTDTPETPTDTPTDTPETPTDTPETPTDTPETPTDTQESPTDTPETPTEEPNVTYYQVDLVVGQPLQTVGPADGGEFYQERLIRSIHGSSEEPVTRTVVGNLDAENASCIQDSEITVRDGKAYATFTVAEGCEVPVSLASHVKPDATFDWDEAQPLHESNTSTFGPGEHTLVVDLPTEDETETNGSLALPDGFGLLTSVTSNSWLLFPFAFVGLALRREP